MFSQDKVKQAFGKYVTLQLNTGPVPPLDARQLPDPENAQLMRNEKFKNFALPYYVIVRVKGNTLQRIAVWTDPLIDDADAFVRFLEKAGQIK